MRSHTGIGSTAIRDEGTSQEYRIEMNQTNASDDDDEHHQSTRSRAETGIIEVDAADADAAAVAAPAAPAAPAARSASDR